MKPNGGKQRKVLSISSSQYQGYGPLESMQLDPKILTVFVVIGLKGIWMCKGKDMDVLVMDVEGADGRERGEDQVSSYSKFTSV
jgi:hypothetical protein